MLIKILHITLIFNLFTSSVGVLVNQHFCKDELKRVAFFAKAESCHTTKKQPACPHHPQSSTQEGIDQKNCCHNTSQYFKTLQEQQVEQTKLSVWLMPIIPTVIGEDRTQLTNHSLPLNGKFYRPPPLYNNFSIRFQIFRL